MSKTITITGQKGGAGKSVTAVNLAASFALMEKKVLLVDADPQGCASQWCGIRPGDTVLDISSILSGRAAVKDAVIRTRLACLDVIPAGFALFQVGLNLARHPGNEKILRLFLNDVKDHYDYIIIDGPSSYHFLSLAAMTAADTLLICMSILHSGFEDFHRLLRMIKYARATHKVPLKIAGVLLNQCRSKQDADLFLDHQKLTDIRQMVFDTVIPEDNAIRKAAELKVPCAVYNIQSPAAQAYLNLADEMHCFFK